MSKDVREITKVETDAEWIERIAKEIGKHLPFLKTRKIVNGKVKLVKIDHLSRLKTILATEGHAGVQMYADEKTALYNQQVAQHIKKKYNKLKAVK